MHTIKNSKRNKNIETKFVRYDQSEKVKSFNGSSVSYAAGVTYFKWLFSKIYLLRIKKYNEFYRINDDLLIC